MCLRHGKNTDKFPVFKKSPNTMALRDKCLKLSLILLFLGTLTFPFNGNCQEASLAALPGSSHWMEYLKEYNNWEGASNPAGLSLTNMHNLGNSYFTYNIDEGDFYRPQDASQVNTFGFTTERYQSLGEMTFRGEFTFHSFEEKDRQWGNVMDPFRGTPYIFSDVEGGDWSKQYYNLNFTAASGRLFGLFYAGIEAHYELYTGARQNDPRPVNHTQKIQAKPGLLFPVGNNSDLGVTGFISNRSEDIGITLVNHDFQHRWYKMRGVGEFRRGFMRGYSRSYEGTGFGGGINYAYTFRRGSLIADADIRFYNEEVSDGSSIIQHGGELDEMTIETSIRLKLRRTNSLHRITGRFDLTEYTGIEHSQSYDNSLEQWVTFATSTRYRADHIHAGADYRFYRKRANNDYDWMAGLNAGFISGDMRYLLPASTKKFADFRLLLKGARNFTIAENNLHLGLTAGYNMSLDDELSIHHELLDGERSDISDNVTIPDFYYLTTDYAIFGLNVTYSFNIGDTINSPFYLRLEATRYDLTSSDVAPMYEGTTRNHLKLSLGMIY